MKKVITHHKKRAAYSKIKEYVKDKYGVNVCTSYIAQVKRMCDFGHGREYIISPRKRIQR